MGLDTQPLIETFRSNREAPRVEPVDIAAQITEWYHSQVFSDNTEQFNNGPLSVNRGAFLDALQPAYVDVENSTKTPNEGQLDIIAGVHRSASIAYWSGAQMERTNPPPGADSVINNPVTNPGSFSVNFPDINSIEGYVELMTDAHEEHLLTVSGVLVARMPDNSVQNFPWTGIS